MENYSLSIYLGILALAISIFVVWLLKKINITEKLRKKSVHEIKDFHAVETDMPIDNPDLKKTYKTGIKNIGNRFTIIKRLVVIAVIIIILVLFSVPFLSHLPRTLISLIVAAFTVIIGIAIRPFLENFVAGIAITFSKLIRIGDTVMIDSQYGTVTDISLTHTTVKIWDWRHYIVSNSKMLNKDFINYSVYNNFYWIPIYFYVNYDADLPKVEELALKAAYKSNYFSDYEEPKFWVMKLEKKCMQCCIAAWADSPPDAWLLKSDINKELAKNFKENKIFPNQIHVMH